MRFYAFACDGGQSTVTNYYFGRFVGENYFYKYFLPCLVGETVRHHVGISALNVRRKGGGDSHTGRVPCRHFRNVCTGGQGFPCVDYYLHDDGSSARANGQPQSFNDDGNDGLLLVCSYVFRCFVRV